MKNSLSGILSALALCSLFFTSQVFAQGRLDGPMTNASVVKLVAAGFKEKTIISIINSRPNQFNLDPDHLIELKRRGVGENVILAMLSQDYSVFVARDDFPDDDSFARESSGRQDGSRRADPRTGEIDIFGSGGRSKAEVRGRGINGGIQGESTSTGSATVRIIRPPAESGGASPKLEKTPSMNNESIVGLVEAGFSDGTIVKRIEDSPVEFDLSAAKLEELRRRRVTDRVIAAMTAAMDDPAAKQSAPGKVREN